MNEEYEYKKEDVEAVLHFLSANFPKKATPENAIKVLVYMHDHMITTESISSDAIEDMLKDLENN
jgi:hypothetical protein